MAEPELAFTQKTFDDLYGRHALLHTDGGDLAGDVNSVDINWLMPGATPFHPTRLPDDYQPKHAKPSTQEIEVQQ